MQCNCGGILRAWYFCAAGYHYRTCEGCGRVQHGFPSERKAVEEARRKALELVRAKQ
jgi:hypothetical protein